MFAVIQTGTIAAVGVAFSKFTAYLIPWFSEDHILADLGWIKISAAQLLAILTILLLTWNNSRGIQGGKLIQRIFTFAKLASLFGLILFGFFKLDIAIWIQNWNNGWDISKLVKPGTLLPNGTITNAWQVVPHATIGAVLGGIAAAMVGSIFSSDAWNNVTFIAGEIKNPGRNIGLSLFLGTLIVTIIYVSANMMYTGVLSVEAIASADKDRVAVAASQVIFGNAGT